METKQEVQSQETQVNQNSESLEQVTSDYKPQVEEKYEVEGIEVSKEEYEMLNKTGETEKNEEVVLPSEEENIELPEKYKGKTPEEIYKLMKIEEEYLKNKKEEVTNKEDTIEETKSDETQKTEQKSEKSLETVANEWINTGEISEESMKFLEEQGISKEQVEIYKEGLTQKANREANELLQEIGTNIEEYKIVNNWLLETKSEQELKEFNEAISKADKTTLKFILKGVYNEYNMNNQKQNTQEQILQENIHSNQSVNKTSNIYKTKSEYYKDARDKRYGKDIAYTNAVDKKLAMTDTSIWYR